MSLENWGAFLINVVEQKEIKMSCSAHWNAWYSTFKLTEARSWAATTSTRAGGPDGATLPDFHPSRNQPPPQTGQDTDMVQFSSFRPFGLHPGFFFRVKVWPHPQQLPVTRQVILHMLISKYMYACRYIGGQMGQWETQCVHSWYSCGSVETCMAIKETVGAMRDSVCAFLDTHEQLWLCWNLHGNEKNSWGNVRLSLCILDTQDQLWLCWNLHGHERNSWGNVRLSLCILDTQDQLWLCWNVHSYERNSWGNVRLSLCILDTQDQLWLCWNLHGHERNSSSYVRLAMQCAFLHGTPEQLWLCWNLHDHEINCWGNVVPQSCYSSYVFTV